MSDLERYEVLEELARGGMGRVLRARDPRLAREVAVKTILGDAAGELAQARFLLEAEITGRLSHPHVISVHELGRDREGELYLAMKLVSGRDLSDLIQGRRADPALAREYPLRRLLRLFLQVCEGVGFAHERGVIHRDLKPANVMLGEGDEVLVMDWGLAKEIAAPDDLARAGAGAEPLEQAAGLTQEGALVGTPAYMPIEQADGARLDARADVYALGAILYELLTGQAPYRGMAMEVVAKLLTAPPPRPRELDPELPPALEAIVLRAMGREPEERYPSAAALAADVSAFLDDEPIAAYPEGPLAGLARLTRTHKLPLAAAALGLLTLVGAALGGRALVETAQRAADEAGAAAAEVEARALSASEQAARAERVVGAARELASEEQRVTRFARSVAAGADLESLIAAHAEARAALGESSASSAELGQLAERLGERRQSARRALDRALLATLVARAPERALEVLAQGQLQPGPERWLAHARALLRLERHAEAAELLAKSDPGDEPRWRRARGALLAVARRADWSEQEAALSAAVQSWRAAAWPYLRRAQARVCLGQREAAEADFARARELDPRDCWNSIAWLEVAPLATHYKLIDLRAQTARELGSPRTAVLAICESALRKSTWQWDRGQAVETLRKRIPGRWESLEEGIRLRLSARSYLIVRDLERALPQARRAVELRPQDPTARAVLAEALLLAVVLDQRQDLLEQDLLEQARAELRAGLEIAPHHPDLCYVGGRLELRAGRAASAEPMLRRGAQASGDSGRWNLLALACLAQSERAAWERGVEAAKHAVAADPYGAYINPERLRGKWAARPLAGDPSWQRTWALLCEKLGRTEEALLHAMRAQTLSRQPNAQRAYGETRRDYFLAARLAEKLQLLEIARQCYGLAAKAPRLQERAEAALKRLGPGED